MLKDFIAKLPIDVISQTEIEVDKILLPTKVNATEFYKEHKEQIEKTEFTSEKAIYLASTNIPKPTLSIRSLLVKGR